MISLGYDNVGLGSIILWAYSVAKPTGPGEEYILPGLSCSDRGGRTNRSTVSYQRNKRKLTVASDIQVSIPYRVRGSQRVIVSGKRGPLEETRRVVQT